MKSQRLQRWLYPALDHTTIVVNSNAKFSDSLTMNDVVHWMSDRFAGALVARPLRTDRQRPHPRHPNPQLLK